MSERQTLSLDRSLLPGASLEDCKLAVVEGPDQGLTVPLHAGRIRIGADPSCELTLSDPAVSALHAELALVAEGVRVRDLGSRNGVFHLGNKILDVVLQPGSMIRLGRTLIAVLPPELPDLPPADEERYGPLLGHSARMRRLFAVLHRIEAAEATVLIEGETGTGKSLLATTIHEHSRRAGRPFVTIDAGAIAPGLLHSEMFGHRRGAFTGAVADRVGAFEQAHGGTLFIDEVGELPLDMQPAFLRVLETGELQRLGAARALRVDVRVMAATNRRLERRIEEGLFRRDLYFRLTVVRVTMPPLRDCPEDILPLARHFSTAALSPALSACLQSYAWPGNVRQLRNAMERLEAVGSLQLEQVELEPSLDFHEAKARMVDQFERRYLSELLKHHAGNLSAASRASGLARNHLRELLRKHGLRADEHR